MLSIDKANEILEGASIALKAAARQIRGDHDLLARSLAIFETKNAICYNRDVAKLIEDIRASLAAVNIN